MFPSVTHDQRRFLSVAGAQGARGEEEALAGGSWGQRRRRGRHRRQEQGGRRESEETERPLIACKDLISAFGSVERTEGANGTSSSGESPPAVWPGGPARTALGPLRASEPCCCGMLSQC